MLDYLVGVCLAWLVSITAWPRLMLGVCSRCGQNNCTVECRAQRKQGCGLCGGPPHSALPDGTYPRCDKVECKGPPCDCPSHPGLPRMFDEFIPSMGQLYGDDTPRANKVKE